MKVYATKRVARFASRENVTDKSLTEAIDRAALRDIATQRLRADADRIERALSDFELREIQDDDEDNA